jgi:transcription initiation factor TFIIB
MKVNTEMSSEMSSISRGDLDGCPRCGVSDLIVDAEVGEEVCGGCGLVLREEMADAGPEWRAFTQSQKEKLPRAGMPASYSIYDKGLSTNFSGIRDGRGKRLDAQTRNRMSRLRHYDNRSKIDDTWRRNLSIAMTELDRLSAKLHLPQPVKEDAAVIYRKVLKLDLIRGRSIDAFVAASLYAACRLRSIPRRLKRVSEASTREHSEVSRSYRLLLRELNLKMPVDDPMKFVSGIASKLEVRRDTEMQAVDILKRAKKRHGLTGKDPRGIAAAALYMACMKCDDRRIQKDVAAAAGTTEVTLRNRLKGLESTLQKPRHLADEATITPHTQ